MEHQSVDSLLRLLDVVVGFGSASGSESVLKCCPCNLTSGFGFESGSGFESGLGCCPWWTTLARVLVP